MDPIEWCIHELPVGQCAFCLKQNSSEEEENLEAASWFQHILGWMKK